MPVSEPKPVKYQKINSANRNDIPVSLDHVADMTQYQTPTNVKKGLSLFYCGMVKPGREA